MGKILFWESSIFCSLLFSYLLFACATEPSEDIVEPTCDTCSRRPVVDPFVALQIFPSDHPLNQDISSAALDTNSFAILRNIGLGESLLANFGSDSINGAPRGIPFITVQDGQPSIPLVFRANNYDANYRDESDLGPFPIPLDAPIEENGQGDSRVIVVDTDNLALYELYNASATEDSWECSRAAAFDLNALEFRPEGWASADAAGLPIFPCLVRYAETQSGLIQHPIRFTLPREKIYEGYVHPARSYIPAGKANNRLPLGGRLRLKADYDLSGFSLESLVILQALKTYGLILADVGETLYISGESHPNWDNEVLQELSRVKVEDFEVIELGEIKKN